MLVWRINPGAYIVPRLKFLKIWALVLRQKQFGDVPYRLSSLNPNFEKNLQYKISNHEL